MTRGTLSVDPTRLIGRDEELATACELLGRVGLLTLTGPGGIGKTQLAIAVAERLKAVTNMETALVDLSAIQGTDISPERVYTHIALALGIRHHGAATLDLLVNHLANRRVLLIMDNCEHLVAAARTCVSALLRGAPKLRVLATSRQILRADEEYNLEVPPLELNDAVTLFTARAAALGVNVTGRDMTATVRDLCGRLDGLPLAIRLAAGRARSLSPRQMLGRLEDRFRLLSANSRDADYTVRHSTLEREVASSYGLCDPDEQTLWARASVFISFFDLEAVEAVCGDDGLDPVSIVDLVGGLIDKSVLTVDNSGSEIRYRLLESLREYGLRKLAALGMVTAVRTKHRIYYARVVADAAAQWLGPDEIPVMTIIRDNLDNITAAFNECLARDDYATAMAIARNIVRTRAHNFFGFLDLARQLLQRVIEVSPIPADAATAADIAATAAIASWTAATQGRHELAHGMMDVAHDQQRTWGLPPSPATLFADGAARALTSSDIASIAPLAAARDAFAEAGLPGDHHMATMVWAIACAFHADPPTAVTAAKEYLGQAETAAAPWAISWALWVDALAALRAGDLKQATTAVNRGLRLQSEMEDAWGQTWSIELAAWIIAARLDTGIPADEARRAAWLLGAARTRQQRLGVSITGLAPFDERRQHALAAITTFLDEVSLAEAMEAGSRGHARAIQVALGQGTPRRRGRAGTQELTDREREVAELVAAGLTSRQIAAQLGRATGTIDIHVTSVRRKLGAPTRAAIGAMLADKPADRRRKHPLT